MTGEHPPLLRRWLDRLFPKSENFFALLSEQAIQVGHTTRVFVDFMATGDPALGLQIKQDEHEADTVKVRNIRKLNEAFSTPIDREDIYRAITDLDEIVNYCKTTVSEMSVLDIQPDKFDLEMAVDLNEGVQALIIGFGKLQSAPLAAQDDAERARKAERKVEKVYRRALANLFKGDDYIAMFKHREIYRHLSNAADRLSHCSSTLHDIAVKMT